MGDWADDWSASREVAARQIVEPFVEADPASTHECEDQEHRAARRQEGDQCDCQAEGHATSACSVGLEIEVDDAADPERADGLGDERRHDQAGVSEQDGPRTRC